MMRIVALNDPSHEEGIDQEEETNTQVSKEAQETIAVSEYLRALSLKQQGKTEYARSLFEDLLRTCVLSDMPNDDKENKLFSVKYNCYRNLGLIYEEREEWKLSLKYLVDAVNLDDSDVFTQCKLGKIAMKLKDLLLAKAAFENCLQRNPNHWGAKDGYLQTLCLMELLDAAYGFALKCYAEDKNYERAIRVLLEIREKMVGSLPYYDGIYGYAPNFDDCPIKYDPEISMFPPYKEIGFTEESYAILDDDFKIPEDELSWIAFGKFILRVYDYTLENNHCLVTVYTWNDWIGKKNVELMPPPPSRDTLVENDVKMDDNVFKEEGEQLNGEAGDQALDESIEGQCDENGEEEGKKNKRRCSDLDFLKEWGWHKNRRSSNRKKQKEEEETVDTSINGYLRRILANYFTQSFEHTKNSPFLPEVSAEDMKHADNSDLLDTSKADAEDEEKFNELTKDAFEEFKATFKNREFDLYIPIYQWLRFISVYWNQTTIPAEIIALYKKIYPIFEGYIDYHSMYHMPEEDFLASFRAGMFYFELMFDEFEETKADIPDEFIRKKDFLQMNLAFLDDDIECTKMLLRLLRLSYGFQIHYNNYKDALGFLYKIEEVFEVPKYHEISIELKNCRHHKMLEFKVMKDLVVKIERKINLASVKNLYETKNFTELVDILFESVIYSTGPKVNVDSLMLKIQTQIQILLECLFSLNRIEECLVYAEKSLFFAVTNFLAAPTEFRLEEWAALANFCLVYVETIIREDGNEMIFSLNDKLPRLVQTLTLIISNQHDTPFDKNNLKLHLINLTLPWIILYPIVQRGDDIANAMSGKKKEETENVVEEIGVLPNSLMMLFTAHEFLGRKQWCMKDTGKLWSFLLDNLAPLYRTPLLEPYRDTIAENLEQTTFCLYGFPAKKARLRHIEDHDAKSVEMTWERAILLFDLYRPDTLPEFDSVKLSSITSEMEQLLQKIIPLIPKCLDIQPFTTEIKNFINGTTATLPKEMSILPSKISSIYYLLADFYFKNQETGKAMKYFVYDLTMYPNRFDAWAAMSLCKQSKLEKRLNSFESIDVKNFLDLADQAINCFNQCLKLKKTSTIVTEFASFTYHLHSFCSRSLKQASENMSMENFATIEDRKEKFVNISLQCFTDVSQAINDPQHELNLSKNQDDSDDNHDEKWLYYFMLGKISEKKKETPMNYLNHYLKSAKYLYEDNATYPIKINHNNPTHLAIESLEVFYRINVCIMKYLEHHSKVNKPTAKLFMRVLKELSTSPFAYNRAKINEDNINALKRKMNNNQTGDGNPAKQQKISKSDDAASSMSSASVLPEMPPSSLEVEPTKMDVDEVKEVPPTVEVQPAIKKIIATEVGSRRGSQESAVTTTTTTSATHSSSTSSDSSSDSSDSDTSSSEDGANQENVFVSQEQISTIYKMCIKNLEECVSRFPEHYKSIYRLVYHFLHVNVDLEKCRQLLLTSSYKTTLGNSINGLFSERKNNNFFNGIWRIPTAEIDRPGNFTSHLSKCIIILMDVLKKTNDHDILLDLAMQLQKVPETEKRYLADVDRKDLYHQALACCVQAFKNKLKSVLAEISDGKGTERDLLSLMLDIFKSHRRTYKNVTVSKDQNAFAAVMIEVYKEYIKDRMTLPDNANLSDLAFKMCQQELNYRKNLEKGIYGPNPNAILPPQTVASVPTTPILVKSVSEINKSVLATSSSSNQPAASNSAQNTPQNSNNKPRSSTPPQSARTKPRATSTTASKSSSSAAAASTESWLNSMMSNYMSSSYMNEYFKMLGIPSGGFNAQQMALLSDPRFASLLAGTTASVLSPSTSPSTSQSSSPKSSALKGMDQKFMESMIKSTYGTGLQQNLISNSLSITTTTITSTSTTTTTPSSSISSSKAQTSSRKSETKNASRKSLPNPAAAMAKMDLHNSGISTKYSSLFGSNFNLLDLPKSLSITPSLPASSSSSTVASKPKSTKEKNQPAMSNVDKFNLNASLSITEGLKGAKGSVSSNKNAALLEYEAFLKSYKNLSQQAATSKKSSPITVSGHGMASAMKNQHKQQKSNLQISNVLAPQKPTIPPYSQKSTSHQQQQQQQKSSSQHLQQKSSGLQQKSTAKVSYDFQKNIASSFLPSPTLSTSPFSLQTPPLAPSPHASSSPKTLQQKLAERKQQSSKSSTAAPKKPVHDVIVLDDD